MESIMQESETVSNLDENTNTPYRPAKKRTHEELSASPSLSVHSTATLHEKELTGIKNETVSPVTVDSTSSSSSTSSTTTATATAATKLNQPQADNDENDTLLVQTDQHTSKNTQKSGVAKSGAISPAESTSSHQSQSTKSGGQKPASNTDKNAPISVQTSSPPIVNANSTASSTKTSTAVSFTNSKRPSAYDETLTGQSHHSGTPYDPYATQNQAPSLIIKSPNQKFVPGSSNVGINPMTGSTLSSGQRGNAMPPKMQQPLTKCNSAPPPIGLNASSTSSHMAPHHQMQQVAPNHMHRSNMSSTNLPPSAFGANGNAYRPIYSNMDQ